MCEADSIFLPSVFVYESRTHRSNAGLTIVGLVSIVMGLDLKGLFLNGSTSK